MNAKPLGWLGIARLGLVQASIGALVVLATSTMNRIMVVELALPAVLPGVLVALHYAVQMARPRIGHGSDAGGGLTRWIVCGMAVLAVGVVGAAASISWMEHSRAPGIAASFLSFLVIGLGVAASGTSLLVLLTKQVEPARRAAAATITWVMMIAGFVLTTAIASQALEPYSHARLFALTLVAAACALVVTALAVWGVEDRRTAAAAARSPVARVAFLVALRQVWSEPAARQFTIFVFLSMLAYSGQELIFEPFAGSVLQLTPAQSARLTSLQHGGALLGMILVGSLGTFGARWRVSSPRGWTIGGCLGSCLGLVGLVTATHVGAAWPIYGNVFLLGLANGVFAVSAITSMMTLASAAGGERQGLRMGLWGGAQAVAFACGGLVSSAAVDLGRYLTHSPLSAFAAVFGAQALLFFLAALLAASVRSVARPSHARPAGGFSHGHEIRV
ncbi:MAG: BCD family MFS transporter [Proteobacteria bacterium]|nr:BCD family MFS transporter [Pseudomonadota bacterium]